MANTKKIAGTSASLPAIKLAGVVAVILLLGFIVWRVTAPPTDVWSYCARLVPGSENLKIAFILSEKLPPALEVGGGRSTDTKDAEIVQALSDCVRERVGLTPVVRWLVSISAEPLGQLANRWRSEPGLQVKLVTPDPASALKLNNLKIGPTEKSLTKTQLMEAWCVANAACVRCRPPRLADESSEVQIDLVPQPPVDEAVFQEVAGAPKSDGTYEPWQHVKEDRKLYFFVCRQP